MPIELLLRDESLTHVYVRGKLEREATHSLLRARIESMEDIFVNPLSRSFLPADVFVAALDSLDSLERLGRSESPRKLAFYKFQLI